MSRIRLTIDRLILNGFESLEGNALSEAMQLRLSQILSEQATQAGWTRAHRTPVMKLGPMALNPGTAGASQLGGHLAQAVARGLKR
jgi:hypothetical protein